MSEFSVSRIVPSTRDLFDALSTRRKSLALIPRIEGNTSEEVRQHAQRLDGFDVRAFARSAADVITQDLARSTSTIPTLCTSEITNAEDCQRARFFGADGIVIRADGNANWQTLSKTAQSMRMMVVGLVTNEETATLLQKIGARAMLLRASSSAELLRLADTAKGASLLLADLLPDGLGDEEDLRALLGKVDAALVRETFHAGRSFECLQDELDG